MASTDTRHLGLLVPSGDESQVLKLWHMKVSVAHKEVLTSATVSAAKETLKPAPENTVAAAQPPTPPAEAASLPVVIARSVPQKKPKDEGSGSGSKAACPVKPPRSSPVAKPKTKFGLCDDGEAHLFPIKPANCGWKQLPPAAATAAGAGANANRQLARTAVCRTFPRYRLFEGREVEVSLKVKGTGVVSLLAGKALQTAAGMAAAQ